MVGDVRSSMMELLYVLVAMMDFVLKVQDNIYTSSGLPYFFIFNNRQTPECYKYEVLLTKHIFYKKNRFS